MPISLIMNHIRGIMQDWNKKNSLELIQIIGIRLKHMRIQKGYTQEELAKLSGVSRPSIVRLETGSGNTSLENILAIMKTLGTANDLKLVFEEENISPLLLAKSTKNLLKERVRPVKEKSKHLEEWQWEEDK